MDYHANNQLQHMYRHVRNLEWDLIRIQNSEYQSFDHRIRKRRITDRIETIKSLIQLTGEEFVPNPLLVNGANFTFEDLQFTLPIRRPFQNQPLELGRYLCLSVGYAVYCLDLKQKSLISTLDLLEEVFPISMGVFRIGSCVYMIAGKVLPRPAKPHSYYTYDMVYNKYGVEGSSRETYCVSLANDRLSLYECGIIPPLNKTKYWPIVEKIGNHLHVIDSIPKCYYGYHKGKTREFSHEVLDLNDIRRGWTELSHPLNLKSVLDTHISQYIVVGDMIYAKFYAVDEYDLPVCLAFNSKTMNWEHVEVDDDEVLHVSQVFGFGAVGCVVAGVLCEELKDKYDVFFVAGRMWAAVYIVDKSGYVVCYNPLLKFFDEVETGFVWVNTKVIAVDKEGSMLCVILHLRRELIDSLQEVYFISTFSFEEVYEVEPDSQSSGKKLATEDDFTERDFMKFKHQECCMYNKGSMNVSVLTGAFFF